MQSTTFSTDGPTFAYDLSVFLEGYICAICLYLCSQQSGQVDLRNHFAAPVSLSLITVFMILHQVPQFSPLKHIEILTFKS